MDNRLNKEQLTHAYVCAVLSRIAYTGKPKFHEKMALASIGYEVEKNYSFNGVQFTIAQSDVRTIVAFRGTDGSLEDLLADLKSMWLVPANGNLGKIGKGFKEYSDIAYITVFMLLMHSDKEITITGHSLGAAVATNTALNLVQNKIFKDRVNLVTFGCPRVGNRQYAWNVNNSLPFPLHQRWVNANDIVTKVPFQFGRFRHSNALQYITTDGSIQTGLSFLKVFLNRYGWFKNSPFRWATDQRWDHSLIRYITRISESI